MEMVSSVSVNVLFAGGRDGNVDSFCTQEGDEYIGQSQVIGRARHSSWFWMEWAGW
jgi:hypothetical protein